MSVIDTLITDRSQADVTAVQELNAKDMSTWTVEEVTEYLAGMKGSYNATDLNRVGSACAYLYGKMTDMGYTVTGYTALKTDWTIADVPTAAQMTTYLNTINALKAVFGNHQTIPNSMNNLGYDGANNIEKLLNEIWVTVDGIKRIFIRSNMITAFSGTGFYILNEEG